MESNNNQHRSIVMDRLKDVQQEFGNVRSTLSKHLADSLAGADHDLRHFIENEPKAYDERDSIADRIRNRAAEFDADHPRISELLREVAELVRSMGI